MINFATEDLKFNLKNKLKIKDWIKNVVQSHDKVLADINIVFTSDNYLYKMNLEYLNHDYYTDIITFNYNVEDKISGDLFISIDRVKENALKYDVSFYNELLRVVIHGILHLLGFDDKTPDQQKLMRQKEDEMLSMLNFNELKW